jgi:hypothetical protein
MDSVLVQTRPTRVERGIVAAGPVAPRRRHVEEKVIIRAWPSVIFYLPTMIAAFICGILSPLLGNDAAADEIIALGFMLFFLFNTSFVAFNFSLMSLVAVVLLVALLLFLGVGGFLGDSLGGLHMRANPPLYLGFGVVFFIMFVFAWIGTRLDFVAVHHNELRRCRLPFGNSQQYPAPQMKIEMEIPDVIKHFIFGSGRLVFHPPGERRAIVVENVMRVNRVERRIKQLLESLEVRIDPCTEEPRE